jgi:diguanylate cyclase (GGDEF)-like protein
MLMQIIIFLSVALFLMAAFIAYYMKIHSRDLAERKRLAMFPERNPNSVSQLSLQGDIIYTNPGSKDLLEKLDIDSRDITLIFPDNIKQKLNELSESDTESAQYVYNRGNRILDCHVQLIKDFSVFHLYIEDITERKNANDLLAYHASHDDLTGLTNRREFERRIELSLSSIKQNKSEHALCFMDLDQFKVVNDTCGHVAGDEMLRQLSAILKSLVRKRDTLARLGGDEFGVLMEHCSLDGAHRVVKTFQKAIQDYRFVWEGRSFKVGVSIGLVPITETTANLTEVMKNADAACYMAKDYGRNRIHVYRPEDTDIAERYGVMQWVTQINRALEEDRFCLYAQIIVPLNNSDDTHYELLLRMVDEEGNIISPGAFLPAAERYSLISQLDRWVIEHAFGLLVEHPVFLGKIKFCSINLSGPSLTDPEILGFITEQLNNSGISGNKICFEITETSAISNLNIATEFISTLKSFGCQFALDDFGSGLSSFGYLKNLRVDYLKIDGMFIKDIVVDPIDHAMVKSINEIGHVMGMQTIAEFVENDEIKGMLREIGINYAQGYGIGKPYPFNELLEQLAT